MKNLAPAASLLLLVAAAGAARADTLRVPSEEFETIQAAVNAAVEGDVVLVAKGTYPETVSVTDKVGVTIRGKSGATIQPGAGSTGIVISGGSSLRISGFVIDGPLSGITLVSAADVEIKKVAVVDPVDRGFSLTTCDGVRIRNSSVTGAGAIGVYDSDSTGVVVEKCVFEDCVTDSVYLSGYAAPGSGSDGAVVARNRISGGVYGVRAGGEDLRVEKNRIEGVTGYGIVLDGSSGSSNAVVEKNRTVGGTYGILFGGDGGLLSKNRIEGALSDGINEFGSGNTIERNTILGANLGIRAQGASVTVEKNIVRMPVGDGIDVYGTAATLEGNRIFDAPNYGIYVQTTGVTLRWNSVVRPDRGIWINSTGALLEQNKVSGAADIGFLITGTPTTLSENRCRGSGVLDLADSSADGVNTYEENRFGTTQFSFID